MTISQQLKLNDLEYFEANGINVLVYSNRYNPIFFDEKAAGVELIHHGVRTATGGAVRLHDTPEQWDLVPEIVDRIVNKSTHSISTLLRYDKFDFDSEVRVTSYQKGVKIEVILEKPIPAELAGRAGFNLEFFPPDYWTSSYLADGKPYLFPRYPASDTYVRPKTEKIQQIYDHSTFDDRGRDEFLVPIPIRTAHAFVLAPENPNRKISIQSDSEIMFFDGRILAQNGCYVFRTLLPAGKRGVVTEWYVEPNTVPDWIRDPNIGFSQVGYTPAQKKQAIIELDINDHPHATATLYKIDENGNNKAVYSDKTKFWGKYLRYNYLQFDFSAVQEEGLYFIEYNDVKTNAFPISTEIYKGAWHPTMDVWLPVQMDHMTVNEGYRIWHGNPYQDDALQAPTNHDHFDGYSMGDTTDTRFKPFERIPGLNVGGWFDAGDFDIQTGSHNAVVMDLVSLYETFSPNRDMTYIDQTTQYVDIHRPDGKNDVLQQIEHGVLALVAQVENIGHPVRGIIVGNLHQYHHLGDASTITDNLPYNPNLEPYETDGLTSGTMDDRWVFTTRSAFLDYSTAASLAAAARVLKEFNPDLSYRALACAMKMWDENFEANHSNKISDPNFLSRRANDMSAALQLYITTKNDLFRKVFENALWNQFDASPVSLRSNTNRWSDETITNALMACPYMGKDFLRKLRPHIVFVVTLFSACNEALLEIPQKGVIDISSFYKTDEDAESALVALYADFITNIGGNDGIYVPYNIIFNYCADNVLAAGEFYGDNDQFASINEFRYDSQSSVVYQMYRRFYFVIYHANLVIDNFKYGESATKDRCISEARVIRAWCHMMAALAWGNPPLVDHVLTGDAKPTNYELGHEALLKWCAQECGEAVQYLDERSSKTDKDGAVKVTKGFAWTVQGKALLNAGDYPGAKTALKKVIASDKYDLVPGNKFAQLFHLSGDGSEEKVFELNLINSASIGDWSGKIQRSTWMEMNL